MESVRFETSLPIPTLPRPQEKSPWEDEEALVAGLQANDEESYELLVRHHGGRMLAVAQRLCRNADEARDVVQEAFLSAFRSIHSFRRGARLGTWLHRITVNAALMQIRRAASRPEVQIDELLPFFDAAGCHVRPLPARPPKAERRVLQHETRRIVRACIDRLPETYRVVILLRDIEELNTREVAELLEVTPNAVKIRLHRARLALARLLSEEL